MRWDQDDNASCSSGLGKALSGDEAPCLGATRREVRECTVRATFDGQAATDLTDARHVVIPMNRLTSLRLRRTTPVLDRVVCAAVVDAATEVGGVQHGGRRAMDESVLSHRTLWLVRNSS